MRRVFFIAAAIFLALTGTAAARYYYPIGVVVVDGTQVKLNAYWEIADSLIKPKSGVELLVGKKIQEQYQKYWFSFVKNSGDKSLSREHMIEFTRFSGCKKVLFLVISDTPDGDKNSLQLDVSICTNDGIQETFTATETFDKPRERRSAFRKCLSEIAKPLNQIL